MKITHRNSEILFLYLPLILIILISGCVQKKDIDQSFTTDSPCTAPCWYGLQLDVSSRADVLATLNNLPFIENRSIHEYGYRWGTDDQAIEIYYDCIGTKTGCGSLVLSGDRLKMMWMSIKYPLTFKQAVDKLGKPEYLEYGVCEPEAPSCRLNLSWPGQRIFVVADLKKAELCAEMKAGNTIPPETQIAFIFYSKKEGFKLDTASCLNRLPWPGFSEP